MKRTTALTLLFLCGCATVTGHRHGSGPGLEAAAVPPSPAAHVAPCNDDALRQKEQEARREANLLAARLQAAEAEAYDLRRSLAEAKAANKELRARNRDMTAKIKRLKLTLERLERLEREMEKKRRELK